MVIDVHAHCFSEAIAAKAMPRLAASAGAYAPAFDGTAEGLRLLMQRAGVHASVVANIATNPRQQRAVNEFAVSLLGREDLIPFGSVHPDAPDALEELQRLHAAGIKGIKLHPDYQQFFVDDPRVFPLYQEAARLGFVVLFHAGVDIGLCDPVHATPARMAKALPYLEGAAVIAAHFGGYLLWQEVMEYLCGKEIYFDTAFSAGKIPPPWARRILELHGPEHLLFGSDTPWSDPRAELAFAASLSEDPAVQAMICGGNAARLLGIFS